LSKTLVVTGRRADQSGHLLEYLDDLVKREGEEEVSLLFICDGVYSLVRGSFAWKLLEGRESSRFKIYGSLEDLQFRGLSGELLAEQVRAVDYEGIVGLIMGETDKAISYV
jgi:sulfur relay protein TusB/DsrH